MDNNSPPWWAPKQFLAEADFRFPYTVIGCLLAVGVIFGVSEAVKETSEESTIHDLEVWKILRVLCIVPGAVVVGMILDTVLSGIISIVAYRSSLMSLAYYLHTLRLFFGQIVAFAVVFETYPDIVRIDRDDTVDKLILFYLIICAGYIIRNIVIGVVMKKQMIEQFTKVIDEVIINKKLLWNITVDPDSVKKVEIGRSDIVWKLLKIQAKGFPLNDGEKICYIQKKDRVVQIFSRIWDSWTESGYVENDRLTIPKLLQQTHVDPGSHHANYVIKNFDITDSGVVTKSEFFTAVTRMFVMWKNLYYSLSVQNHISDVLNVLLVIFLWVIYLIILLNLFDISVSSVAVPIATVMLSLAFAFGKGFGDVIYSIIFVVFMEPYRVGDKISVNEINDGNTFVVEKINILTTVCREVSTGRVSFIPNYVMAEKPIQNLHRSGTVVFPVSLKIRVDADNASINTLREEVTRYINKHPEEWRPITEYFIGEINTERGFKEIVFWLHGYLSWTDNRIWDAHNRCVHQLTVSVMESGIGYTRPIQPITMIE